MGKMNDLEANVQNLVETKLLNLDVSLGSIVKGGALAGLDPWDVFCGNGWVLRRWPGHGPIRIDDLQQIREVVRQELGAKGMG